MVARLFYKHDKRMRRIIFSAILAMFFICGRAYDFEVNGYYYNIISLTDRTVSLTYDESVYEDGWINPVYTGDFRVPGSVEYSGKLFSVIEIDKSAFCGAILGTLTIPENIIRAKISAKGIEKLVIEDSDVPLESLDFSEASPEEAYVGRYCIGGGLEYSAIKRIYFGEKQTSVPNSMCFGSGALTTVGLPAGMKTIEADAFGGCGSLREISCTGVEELGHGAFCFSRALETFNFPNLKTLGYNGGYSRYSVFQGCNSLKNVVLPQGVAKLFSVFNECEALETIIFPASVVEFSRGVIKNCPQLKTITVSNPQPIKIDEDAFDAQTYLNVTLKVPAGSKEKYMAADNWNNFFNIEEDASISDDVFSVVVNGIYEYYGGIVEIDGKQIVDENVITTVKKGDRITLCFVPYRNFELGSVKINGVDMTSEIVDGKLIIDVEGSMAVDVEWDEVTAKPALLTIKHAENGCLKMAVTQYSYLFYVEPAVGWKLHTVTFNGTDIMSQVGADGALVLEEIYDDAILSVAFEADNTAVSDVKSNAAKVYGVGESIVVSGADDGEPVNVYNEAGMLVASVKSEAGNVTISVACGHVYIVKLKGMTVKIAI